MYPNNNNLPPQTNNRATGFAQTGASVPPASYPVNRPNFGPGYPMARPGATGYAPTARPTLPQVRPNLRPVNQVGNQTPNLQINRNSPEYLRTLTADQLRREVIETELEIQKTLLESERAYRKMCLQFWI